MYRAALLIETKMHLDVAKIKLRHLMRYDHRSFGAVESNFDRKRIRKKGEVHLSERLKINVQ